MGDRTSLRASNIDYDFGVGLSKTHCKADDPTSHFTLLETGDDIYELYSFAYGELKVDGTLITPRGHRALPFTLVPDFQSL
ncbi:hypothetical protein BGZ73_006023 [Actinomortierella ambigua]|nr:hypothetical protein BGZ73_006023 [Actinomortierella ambigua]